MLLMFMEGIRGGLSCIMKRYVKANDKYMNNSNPNKESIYLVPVDANNLYGYAMQFKLPYKGFQWCTTEEINYLENNILNLSNDNDISETHGIEDSIGYTLKLI